MASCKNDFLCTLDEVQFECTLYRFSLRKPSSCRYQHSKEVMASQKIKFVLIRAIRRDFRKEQDRKCPWPKVIGYCKLVVKCYNRFAFTSAIYKCSYCFINSKANLTLVKVVLNWSHNFFPWLSVSSRARALWYDRLPMQCMGVLHVVREDVPKKRAVFASPGKECINAHIINLIDRATFNDFMGG